MVILITLAALFATFIFVRHRIGPSLLAMLAGISIYDMFGGTFIDVVCKIFESLPRNMAESGVYVALVAIFPLILYFRSHRGGLFGILRLAEAAIFAALLTSLLAPTLAMFFQFDTLAYEINNFISLVKTPIALIGVVAAYIDIILYRD